MPYKDPSQARRYYRDYKRLHRAGLCQTPCTTQVPTEFRLKTARDVLRLLEEQARAVRSDPDVGTCERARTITQIASVALRAVESGDLSARLEAVETVLKGRKRG